MQEEDLLPDFLHHHVEVAHRRELVGELRQFVVVRREHRLAADLLMQVLAHCPRDRQSIPCRRTASDLVEQHDTAGRGRVQDRARLGHLHHERGLPAHEIVARTHAGEHAVRDADARRRRRDVRSHLRHQYEQPDLPEDGALARHVGAREDDHPLLGREPHIVRDELVARHHALHHRMPPAHDLQRAAVIHYRPHVPLARCDLGQRGEYVELRNARGDRLQSPDARADPCAQCLEYLALEHLHALRRVQHLLLELLQRRRHVALSARQRLAALVVGGHAAAMRVRDLDVIAEHAVVADLERGDARARALFVLQRGDRILAAAGDRAQLVESGVDTWGDRLAITDRDRWPRDQRLRDLLRHVRCIVPASRDAAEHSATRGARECTRDIRQSHEGIAQCAQVAWRRASCGGLAGQSLHVSHTIECIAQRRARERVGEQRFHGIEPCGDRSDVGERREDPLTQ